MTKIVTNATFKQYLELGYKGEMLVERAIGLNPFLSVREDVREDPFFQSIDIDYLISIHLNERISQSSLEVKSDYKHKHTGNMFFQEFSNINTGRVGDIFRTESEYLAYVFVPEQKIWLFKTSELQDWLINNSYRFKKVLGSGAFNRTSGWIIPSRLFFDNTIGYSGFKLPLRLSTTCC